MSNIYHFKVNLGGMLDVLSNHLYKSPDVFLRELLQNGVDAVTLRQKEQPGWTGGRLTIAVEPGRRLIFRDNGAGLSEEGIHRFLAVIGQSSKTELVNGKIPEDYIGRFGIGLLSCFMVSDSIVVHTRPAAGGPAHVMRSRSWYAITASPCRSPSIWTAIRSGSTASPPTSPASAAASFSPSASGCLTRSFWRPSPSRPPTSAAWPMCCPIPPTPP